MYNFYHFSFPSQKYILYLISSGFLEFCHFPELLKEQPFMGKFFQLSDVLNSPKWSLSGLWNLKTDHKSLWAVYSLFWLFAAYFNCASFFWWRLTAKEECRASALWAFSHYEKANILIVFNLTLVYSRMISCYLFHSLPSKLCFTFPLRIKALLIYHFW